MNSVNKMEDINPAKTGTTILGIWCKEGVIIAADKRTTAGGMIVAKIAKKSKKLSKIADRMMVGQTGLVSDAQLLTKLIKAEIKLKDIQTNRQTSVKEAANLLAGMSYANIRRPSMVPGIVAFLMAGYDEEGGPQLFNIGVDGSILKVEDYESEGSGSVFALGTLEANFKKGMTTDEATNLAIQAINAAMQRDTASGNGIDVYVITEKGIRHLVTKLVDYSIKA